MRRKTDRELDDLRDLARVVGVPRRQPAPHREAGCDRGDSGDREADSERIGVEDWEIDDPAESDLEGVRRIRDDIDERVRGLSEVTAGARA